MWKRKTMKKNAVALIKSGYWRMVSVCFLIAMLTTAYSLSTSFLDLQFPSASLQTDAAYTAGIPNSEVLLDTIWPLLEGTPLAGISEGMFSDIYSVLIDLFSTNISVFFSTLRAVYLFFSEDPGIVLVFPLFGIIFALFYQTFVSNILIVGEKRFFLENRKYPQTSVSKIFFLYGLRCALHPAWIMFCRSFFQFLWNLTIFGGIVKHYQYILIPYILAENPKISRRNAFFLSKQLTRRNKWKFFLFDLSFFGWKFLSLFTFGLLDFLFVNPYMAAAKTEIYATLRRNYVLSRSPGYESLNDSYLEHVPSEDELLISKALYDDSQGPYTKLSYFEPLQYPVFLFSVQPPSKAVKPPVRADRKYGLLSYLFLFQAFSIFGWLLETLLHLINSAVFVSDSVLPGPWIPVYGVYGVLILLASRRVIRKPAPVFFISLVLYSILEYCVNTVTELVLGSPMRDYSYFFLNLDGRVYLGGSIALALIGCAFVYYLAPRWTDMFLKLKRSRRILLCAVLYFLFNCDIIFTVFS